MSLRPIVAILASAAFVFIMVPVFASAQYAVPYYNNNCGTYPYSTSYNYSATYPYNTNLTNCNQGNLLVYVQVTSNPQVGVARVPSDFTATVSGQNPSPSSFPGSLSGVNVSVFGSYSVSVLPIQGFSPSYSTGCSGTLTSNEQALCVITENQTSDGYYSMVHPYPYPYIGATSLTCSPAYQTVNLGQSAVFWAQGGSGGTYNWSTPDQTFLGVDSSLTTSLRSTGTHTVTVSNGTQTATCTVNVVAGVGPVVYTAQNNTNFGATYTSATTAYPAVYSGQTAIASTYVPALPNTGFEPLSVELGQHGGAPLAFALVILGAAGVFLSPYVRKIIISPVR